MTVQAPHRYAAGDELPPLARYVTQAVINQYAEASGDHNPLHTDEEFAAGRQFGGTIAHGMLVLAYLSEMLAGAFGRRWASSGRMKARFRAPARPGDTITAGGRVTRVDNGILRCEAECRNEAGEVLASAEVQVPA
ncbi:MAG TPA: MaoC family dehydratase [Dehalococcoidia bacterium]|nr:MaoC family dehydratase [Dehalococcoidia bacterium]